VNTGLILRATETLTDATGETRYAFVYLCCSLIFMPPPFEEWWRGIKCYPCPCVRSSMCVAFVHYQNLVSAQKVLKECIDSIQIWYVDIKYQNTGQVRFGLQYTNF